MDRYRVDYMDEDGEIITITIEASHVVEYTNLVIFCDEQDYHVFYKKDVVSYKKEKK